MQNIRKIIQDWLPPMLVKAIKSIKSGGHTDIEFRGDFATWEEASRQASGYDGNEIFQRVRIAASQVKRGEAVFERDAVCFYHEEYRWEVLACLMMAVGACGGRLNVLDFGGALGGFYSQHKKFISEFKNRRWGVVEQQHYVECGKAEFEDDCLKFYSSIEECAHEMPVNIVLLSSVLQYIEKPYELLKKISELDAKYIVIDRTTFSEDVKDKVVVQIVPKSIFQATLPMRVFSGGNFDCLMTKLGYSRLVGFTCAESNIGEVKFSGMLYRREK